MPISYEGQNEEEDSNDEQAAGLGGIEGMTMPMLVFSDRLRWSGGGHEDIVAPGAGWG